MRRAIYECDAPPKAMPGEVLLQKGLAEEAYLFLKREYNHNDYRSVVNMGACLRTLGRIEEAKEEVKHAIDLNPRCENAWYNLALIMEDYGEFERAREAIGIAYKLLPIDKAIAIHYATINMRLGWWGEVKDQFEFGREEFYWYPYQGIPAWHGQDLTNKRVLVVHEGGFGDFFWLIRYFRLLKDLGCYVTHLAWKKQKEFSERLCPYVDRTVAAGEFIDTNDYDYQMGLWSLLWLHDGPLSMTEPYITPPKLNLDKPGFMVGLSWHAEEMGMARKFRSIPIEDLEAIRKIPAEYTALSLTDRIPDWCHDPRQLLNRGWIDTAAVIDRCDLVITVDTANAHIAGAMGKPTWLLLPKNSFWQWGTEYRSFTEKWYPTMVPMRNQELLIWKKLIGEVSQELAELSAEKCGVDIKGGCNGD